MESVDDFGPEKIVEVYDPSVGMRGVLVIDNTALGPGKGGIRMTPTVGIHEVKRLARAMTWKCSLARLPFGGAKSGIVANPRNMSPKRKEEIVAAFAKSIQELSPSQYICAPDMSMAEGEMRIIAKANGKKSVTGKPKALGGIPHELGSTGWGTFHAVRVAAKFMGLPLKGATVAVEGFGNVGWFVAKFLCGAGAKLVAVSDSRGMIYNPQGIHFAELAAVKKEKRTVIKYLPGKIMPSDAMPGLKVDILVTAAIPDFISVRDVKRIKAKLIVEGSNIPMRASVERLLWKKGVVIVPDFVANAGGVISSYVEYTGGKEKKMFRMVEDIVGKNTLKVLKEAKKENITPREAAMDMAKQSILKARKQS